MATIASCSAPRRRSCTCTSFVATEAEPEDARALEQPPVAGAVAPPQRPLQLDAQAGAAERLVEQPAALQRDPLVGVHECAVARAARQADEPLGALAQQVQRRARARAVARVRGGEQLREVGVAHARLDQQRDVEGTVLVVDRQLAAGDGPQAQRLGRVRELERAAEVVVIGQRERPVAELVRTGDQLLRPRRAVEEGVGRVAVELRVGGRQRGPFALAGASFGVRYGRRTYVRFQVARIGPMSSDAGDVHRIALSLPHATQDGSKIRYLVDGGKAFAWTWKKRIEPKRARVEQLDVFAVRVANEEEKQVLIASDPAKFFTEPHYNGYPAVLVRLDEIDSDELTELLTDAWRIAAPRKLVAEFDADPPRSGE